MRQIAQFKKIFFAWTCCLSNVVVVVCFVNSMVTWVWPWGQFHLSESESLLGMSMSRGLFGMFLSGGLPGSGGLLFMSMFMGLLGMQGICLTF